MHSGTLVRRSEYVAMPWRNGGGVTFEIAREPAAAAGFDWRLSLASIERSGPFSNFAGYQRAIALVSGAGCVLHGIETRALVLRAPGELAIFPGAAQVTSDLIDGPCRDLNLMVREPGRIVRVTHLSAMQRAGESLDANRHGAVFCLSGTLQCVDIADGRRVELGLHDTLVVNPAHASRWRVHSGNQSNAALLCTWEAVATGLE